MHIDHKQFIELLTETSGIEAEKVEEQIAEMIEEVNQALADGEAYEIEGFGIFSGLGNRVLFIPSKELETEINFKYVGMEPIELEVEQSTPPEESKEEDDDPFKGLMELDAEKKEDPFSGLLEDNDVEDEPSDEEESDLVLGEEENELSSENDDDEEEEPRPGPSEWGIEAHKEDDKGANKLLSSLMGEQYSDKEESVPENKTSFDDIFGEEEESDKDESIDNLDNELSSLISDDETGPLDDAADVFDEIDKEEDSIESEEEPVEDSKEEIDLDDFDDPFLELEDESEEEEIVPVIKNISSGLSAKPEEEPEPKKKEKKEKPLKPKKDPQPVSVWLWIILLLVLITGTTLGLGYFSIINIPGITPQVAINNTPVSTPQLQAEQTPPVATEDNTPDQTPVNSAPGVQEQEELSEVPVPVNYAEIPADQNKYGMMGVANEAANDGYTIVLYSLSVESSAFAKQRELNAEGYRAIVTPIASEQYGTLWRVSIGQFPNLTEAALASEEMDAKFKQSYFIKRIIN